MKPIIHAILNGNIASVRKILAEDSNAIRQKSETGRTPIQVAYAAGNFPMCAALLKNSPHDIAQIPISVAELLEELIRDFSQSTLCSSWNQNIEFDLWALITEDSEYKLVYAEYLEVNRESLSEMRWVAEWAKGWFHWADSEDSPVFIDADEWAQRYRTYRNK
jgi:ankyrin repeat protein